MRKGEREIACYERDGPFARRCSRRAVKRGGPKGGMLLELGIFTRSRLGQAKHVSAARHRYPLLLAWKPRNQIERVKTN